MNLRTSVTRFGEISPLWQCFKSLGKFCKGLFSVWQFFHLLWQCFKSLGKFCKGLFSVWPFFHLLWQLINITGPIFTFVNGKIFN